MMRRRVADSRTQQANVAAATAMAQMQLKAWRCH